MTVRRWAAMCAVVAALLAIPSLALAQSTQIRGVAKDSTGGALPGVTVEAKSDVLIEGSKSTQTDGEGQYSITDLRPGKYTVTFTLQGFQTVTNKDVTVTADTATAVNAAMGVGGRSEELTITGAAPTVDVSNATKITTLERSVLDNLPIGSNIWEMAQMIPAIDMYSDFSHRSSSVSGSLGSVQNYMSVNGQLSSNNVVMVDGMSVSGLELNGTMQAYFNNDMNSEVSYQTSGISADRSGGGVTVNMIPREGGNRFAGDFKSNYRPQSWIGENVGCDVRYTATCAGQDSSVQSRLNSMGLNSSSSLKFLEDETISQGGPIAKNKLWFFGSWHQFRTSNFVSNAFNNDGSQFDGPQTTRQGSGRLTYQMSPRVKVSGYYDRTEKFEGNMIDSFDDPETSGYVRNTPNYGTGNVKATATLTSRMLLEGGYSFNREYRNDHGLEEFTFQRGTPDWYVYPRKTTAGGAVNTYGTCGLCRTWPARDNYQGLMSYVTGAHQMKVGVQLQQGHMMTSNDGNADSWVNYTTQQKASCPHPGNCNNSELVPNANGYEWLLTGPSSVTAWNTPTQADTSLNADLGVYFQDSYRFKRVTVNPGLRWEHINSQSDPATIPEGRWAPRRVINGVQNVPDWYDWAPRFNAVWDVFGNARTAVKYSVNRYNQAQATGTAQAFNVLTVTSRTLPWTVDKNGNDFPDGSPGFVYDASGKPIDYGSGFCTTAMVADPSNPCEVDMTSLKTAATGALFGTPAAEQAYQGYPRSWLFENIVEVQHALTRRLSLTASWTRSDGKDLTKTVNPNLLPGDWSPYTIYNPIDGTPMMYYSLTSSAVALRQANTAANVSYVEPLRKQINQTYSLEFRMRPFAGAQVFGGFTAQRFESVNCGTSVAGYMVDPNSLRFCDQQNLSQVDDHGVFDSSRTGDINGIPILGFASIDKGTPIADSGGRQPLAKDFRLGVSLPLPWYGVNLGVNYLNNDEGAFQVVDPLNYTVTLAGAFATTGATACGGGSTRYPDGLTGCSAVGGGTPGQNDSVILGSSNTRKIATAAAPACPTTYGCVPGAQVNPNGTTIIPPLGGTTVTRQIVPDGRIRRERLNQLDMQVSKTFRFSSVSVLPTFSVGNLFNQAKINAISSAIYATTTSNYAVPSSVLQSRILGVGVQVRW